MVTIWTNYLTERDVAQHHRDLFEMSSPICDDDVVIEYRPSAERLQMRDRFRLTFTHEPIQTDWRMI